MKSIIRQLGCAVMILGSASISFSQVKRVEMHIAGYLCGN
jgi:hypothetical protein